MVALVSTLHDPHGRYAAALAERGARLSWFAGTYVRVTDATAPGLVRALRAHGATVVGGAPSQIGEARRLALRAAFEAGHAAYLYCDFDRWLHWAGAYPDELRAIPERAARQRPWYVCLGRTPRAFQTHPFVQRAAECATNHAFGLAVGRGVDATAGACWLSADGARLILDQSTEPTNATDLEWPAIVFRADPRRLGFLETEGLEFETAEFHGAEITAAGGPHHWETQTYERPEVWRARLRLAADSVAAAVRVLASGTP